MSRFVFSTLHFMKSTPKQQQQDLEITLSARGFQHLPSHIYESDFAFSVGKRSYQCPSFIAAFLSPRIANLQTNDPTIREYVIETADPNHLFPHFLSAASGSPLQVSRANSAFFRAVCAELWNREAFNAITAGLDGALTSANALDRIEFLSSMGESHESEIAFCSAHFSELDASRLTDLPLDVLSSILSQPSLKLSDEDSLYNLIERRVSRDPANWALFEFVRFEHLPTAPMRSFVQLASRSLDWLSLPIWRALSGRLSLSVVEDERPNRRGASCPYRPNAPLDGIIAHLARRHGGHVMDRGAVAITASSAGNAYRYPLRNVADFQSESRFYTGNQPGQWICYDFGDMRVRPTHYAIQSRCDSDSYQLRQWVLEGSLDGEGWELLDSRTYDDSLRGREAISAFVVAHASDVRMIRLRQTGRNSSDTNSLTISALEFFGALSETK